MKGIVKKIRKIAYVLLGLAFLGMPFVVWAQAAPEYMELETVELEMEVVYGFQNNVKSTSCVPVRVKVSSVEGAWNGTIQVEIPVQSEENLNASIWMSDVDGISNKEQCYYWEREVALENGQSLEEVFYLELPFYEGYFEVSLISEDEVWEQEQIYIDNTENQSRLLVGVISKDTGEAYQLNGMRIETENYYNSDVFIKAISLQPEELYENPSALEQLDVLIVDEDINFTDTQKMAIEIWRERGGFYYEKREESLSEAFLLLCTGQREEAFQNMLKEMGNYRFYGNDFDNIPLKEKISIGRYLLIIAVYLLLVGPGLFWLLRSKKDPRWLIGSVCVLSASFIFVVYLTGKDINMSAPTICYETLYEQQGEYLTENVEFSVQAYQMQNFELELDGQYDIFPQNVGVDGTQSVNEQTAETIAMGDNGEKMSLLLENMSAYRQNCFSMEKYTVLEAGEQITFQISGTGDYLQVQWENPTAYTVRQAVLVLQNRIAILGDLEPYSQGILENAQLYAWSDSSMSVLLNSWLDFSEYDFPEYVMECMANTIWEETDKQETEEPFVMGILENPFNPFAGNVGFEVYGTAMMKIDVDILWETEQICWCPNLEIYGEIYKGEYSAEGNLLLSREAIVDYDTAFLGKLESLLFFAADYNREEYDIPFEGNIYLFNWQTGTFTELSNWREQLGTLMLDSHVSDTGILRVYYVMDEWLMNSNRSCVLPCMKASGKVEVK